MGNKETSIKPPLASHSPSDQRYSHIQDLLPSVYSCSSSVELLLRSGHFARAKVKLHINLTSIRSIMQPVESELIRFCSKEWELENKVHNGLVCSHILAVVAISTVDKEFKLLDDHDKSIILWGSLFHDIVKRGPPEIDTKDPFHPFTSAAAALRIFSRLGWVAHPELVDEVVEYINSSYFYSEWANFMDNSRLPGIYQRLLHITGISDEPKELISTYYDLTRDLHKEKLYVFEILAIIMFHQSFDVDSNYPNFTPLSKEEIRKYASPRIVKLVALLGKGDNGSYCLSRKYKSWGFLSMIDKEAARIIKSFV